MLDGTRFRHVRGQAVAPAQAASLVRVVESPLLAIGQGHSGL